MKSTVENLSPTRVRLAVEVPFDELKPSLDAAYKEIGSAGPGAGLPARQGARPASSTSASAAARCCRRRSTRRCRASTPRPPASTSCSRSASPRSTSPTSTTRPTARCSFTAEVDVRPEITLPDARRASRSPSTTSRSPTPTSTSSSTSCATASARSRASSAPVEDGDYVSLDLVADRRRRGGRGRLGQGPVLRGRLGRPHRRPGRRRSSASRPASRPPSPPRCSQGEHAGSEAEVTATVNSVKVKELPEVDDEFAQLASEFDTDRRAARRPAHPAGPRQGAGAGRARPATSCSSS